MWSPFWCYHFRVMVSVLSDALDEPADPLIPSLRSDSIRRYNYLYSTLLLFSLPQGFTELYFVVLCGKLLFSLPQGFTEVEHRVSHSYTLCYSVKPCGEPLLFTHKVNSVKNSVQPCGNLFSSHIAILCVTLWKTLWNPVGNSSSTAPYETDPVSAKLHWNW